MSDEAIFWVMMGCVVMGLLAALDLACSTHVRRWDR